VVQRRRRARRQGCWIESTRGGLLRFRFRWRLPGELDFRKLSETTELRDTPENRSLLAKQAAVIGAEIRAGTFDYARWFPGGQHAASIQSAVRLTEPRRAKRISIGEYYQVWIERKFPPLVRLSRIRDYRNHFRNSILPSMSGVELAGLSLEHLEDLRRYLQVKRGLGMKTIRNVIDSSLRAMFRDARKAGVEAAFPFGDLEWPRRVVPGPDPFTEEERDHLLEYFLRKEWHMGRRRRKYQTKTFIPYYAFLFTLFYTGMRPSEAVALRFKSLDLGNGTLFVERSRSLGADAAPKTAAAVRVVRLTPRNIEILRALIELGDAPNDFVFKNTLGAPVEQRNFYKLFRSAQRALSIRLRDLYATKDTYVSTALTRGVNLTWLSEQTGVADATLRRHYGRFIHADAADALELSKIDSKSAESVNFAPPLPLLMTTDRKNSIIYKENLVEQKGFEPSTPTLRT
jgi:integrase